MTGQPLTVVTQTRVRLVNRGTRLSLPQVNSLVK